MSRWSDHVLARMRTFGRHTLTRLEVIASVCGPGAPRRPGACPTWGHRRRYHLIPLIAILAFAGCAKRYHGEGLVTAVDPAQARVTISHRAIPGYMPAMVMPFRLARPDDGRRVHPGDRVRFELRSAQVRNLRVIGTKQDFPIAAPAHVLKAGDAVPDFELTDQLGRPLRFADLRGRVTAIDFVYTRCPLPDVCPRLSASFAYAARALRDKPVTFVSVTVDPQFDTPAVLNAYAQRYGADSEQWRFLTGDMERIKEVAGWFGLVFWPEENMIAHTVTTAVVDREGRIAALIQGSSFRPAELRDLIESTLDW